MLPFGRLPPKSSTRKPIRPGPRRSRIHLSHRLRSEVTPHKLRRPTVIDPHAAYLEQRWSEGCRNAAELGRELTRRGAVVSPRVVRDWAMRRRRTSADALDAGSSAAGSRWKPPTINRTAFLLQADLPSLEQEDRAFVERLL